MDTWWKKFKYNKVNKVIAIVLICIAGVGILQSMSNFIAIQRYEVSEKNYFETYEFKERLVEKAGYVRDWIVRYQDEAIFKEESISKEQIEEYKENLKQEYSSDIKEEELKQLAISRIIKDRKEYLGIIERELLNENNSFLFVAYDQETKNTLTNIKSYTGDNGQALIKVIKESSYSIQGNAETINKGQGYVKHDNYYQGDGIPYKDINRYEVYASVDIDSIDQLQNKDDFAIQKKIFDQKKELSNKLKEESDKSTHTMLLISLIMGIIAFSYITWSTGKTYSTNAIQLTFIDKIPFEVQGSLLILVTYFSIKSMVELINNGLKIVGNIRSLDILQNTTGSFYVGAMIILFVIDILLGLVVYLSCVRHLKNHTFLRNTVVGKIGLFLYSIVFNEKTLPIGLGLSVIAYIITNLTLIMLIFNTYRNIRILFLFAVLVLNGLVMLILFKLGTDFQKIIRGTQKIAEGNLAYQIEVKQTLPVLKKLTYDINHIREGLSKSVEEATKSERMKTELITNVSHDLKTPLTSIISYVELLKAENIENKIAREYIDVLVERSQRLKHLIEDLVEVSKAATGNIGVDLNKIQLHQLIEQVVGEYMDRLEQSKLEVIFTDLEETTILADPKHMWRIAENLLSNISKYAIPHTRVYVEVKKSDAYGILTFRNISREPLKINPVELTERFVRGDESRNTEGSGLGLAIAQSLANIQKGKMEITLDGDLFKIVVSIPLAK